MDAPLEGCPGAELVCPTPDLVEALAGAAVAPDAVLPAADEHFVTWLRGRSAQERHDAVRDYLPVRSAIELDGPWNLALVITVDGMPVGAQRLTSADDWPVGRTVYTSGWLLRDWQGQGLGTAARRAVLAFAFRTCAAAKARSHVLVENTASRLISERLGYEVVKGQAFTEDGRELVEVVYELLADDWRAGAS